MARIRTLKPEWPNSRDLRRLSAGGVTIWWILVSQADDQGRLHADADDVARMARPWAEADEVAEQLDRMARQKMIGRYSVAGEPYMVLLKWGLHQYVQHPTPSRLPAPPPRLLSLMNSFMNGSGEPHEYPRGPARTGSEGKGSEGKGSEGRGAGRETPKSRAEALSAMYDRAADELDGREVLDQ